MNNTVKTTVHLSTLQVGDTVEYEGQQYTVSKNDVRYGFMGYSFKGDASNKYVTKIQFAVPTANGIVLR